MNIELEQVLIDVGALKQGDPRVSREEEESPQRLIRGSRQLRKIIDTLWYDHHQF